MPARSSAAETSMRRRRISNWVFLALALSLHLGPLAGAYHWYAQKPIKRSAPSLAVEIIVPAAPASLAPPAPAQVLAPEKSPKRKSTTPKPKPIPKQTTPSPRAMEPPPSQPPVNAATTPLPSPAPAQEAASAAPSAQVTQTPVKTGVSVNASYVATQTEKWYPSLSKRYGEQGTVMVRVHVSADGLAERVELKKRSGYPLLDDAAIGLARSLKYNPAKVDGNPVADWVDIPITFRLHNP